jgi:hypothetical protein
MKIPDDEPLEIDSLAWSLDKMVLSKAQSSKVYR